MAEGSSSPSFASLANAEDSRGGEGIADAEETFGSSAQDEVPRGAEEVEDAVEKEGNESIIGGETDPEESSRSS